MDIKTTLLDEVRNGKYFEIDFANRGLKLGKKMIIDKGEVADGYELGNDNFDIDTLENLYLEYKYSLPGEHTYGKYFKALPVSELTDEEMMIGLPREEIRAELEFYLLNGILHGITWSDITEPNKWFYEGKYSMILLREWFTESEVA